ncbi:MAG: hypothetical protein U0230_18035 [Polyangiales bacterium]
MSKVTDRRVPGPHVPPSLRAFCRRIEATFGFKPDVLVEEVVRILGQSHLPDPSVDQYLFPAAARAFPGRPLGFGAVSSGDEQEFILCVVLCELYRELEGTAGTRARARQATIALDAALDGVSTDGLEALEQLATGSDYANRLEVSASNEVAEAASELVSAVEALRACSARAKRALEATTYISPLRHGGGRGAPNSWHLAVMASFLHDHGVSWNRIAELLQDDAGRGNAGERMRKLVQRHRASDLEECE